METSLKRPHVSTAASVDRLSRLLNSSLDVICSIDARGSFLVVSNAALHLWGYHPFELEGKPYLEFVVEEDRVETALIAEQIMSGLTVTNFENRYRRKDGTMVPIVWSARWDSVEQVMYCVAKDATEKKRAEEALVKTAFERQAQVNKTRQILESISDGYFEMDADWRVTYYNSQAELLTGKSREEMLGQVFWNVFPSAVGTVAYTQYQRVMKDKVKVNFEMYSKLFREWFEITAYPSDLGVSVYFKNISERKWQEQELQSINRRYELISKATSDVIWDWDLASDTISFGETLEDLFGYKHRSGSIKDLWIDRIYEEDCSRVIVSLKAALLNANCDRWESEYRFLRSNGSPVYVLDRGFIIRDEQGMALRMVGSLQDISRVKEKEHDLTQLSMVATETSDAVIITDAHERITWVNRAFTKITEYTAEEAIGKKPSELLQGKNTSARVRAYLRHQIQRKEPFTCEIVNYSKSGREYWIELKGQPIFNANGALEQIFAIQTDVTERFELQRMVMEEHIAAQQEITKAIIDTQEVERSKLGRELHDNVNQIIATIKLYLEHIDHVPEKRGEFLAKAIELSELAITESRRLSHQLVTPEIRKEGFREAIERLLDHYAAINLFAIDFGFTICEDRVSKDFCLTIYRILQEALNNVVKYAGASEVYVGILYEDQMVNVVVQDNGKGMASSTDYCGLGLRNIQNRAGLYQGKLTVKSSPGAGCTIKVQFPTVDRAIVTNG